MENHYVSWKTKLYFKVDPSSSQTVSHHQKVNYKPTTSCTSILSLATQSAHDCILCHVMPCLRLQKESEGVQMYFAGRSLGTALGQPGRSLGGKWIAIYQLVP